MTFRFVINGHEQKSRITKERGEQGEDLDPIGKYLYEVDYIVKHGTCTCIFGDFIPYSFCVHYGVV